MNTVSKELTEVQITELVNIGSQYLYESVLEEGRISELGVLAIIEKYKEYAKEKKISAEEFLKSKGLIKEGHTKFIVTHPELGEINFNDWMEEYASQFKQDTDKGNEPTDKDREIEELNEECKRLAGIAEHWQNKYYELNPPIQPSKLDNL